MKLQPKIKMLLVILIAVLVLLITGASIYMYPVYNFFFRTEIQQTDKDLTLVLGGGGNSGVLVTEKAVVVIDTKMGSDADDLFKLVKEKAGTKKLVVINTHYHGDHVRGNHLYKGSPVYTGNYDRSFLQKEVDSDDMPDHFVKDSLALELGSETVMLYDLGQAHTWHDLVVYLKNRKILFSGDLIFHHVNPVLKKESGADVDKWIAILDRILKMPDVQQIVPGHGVIGGKEMAESFKTYFADMKTAAKDPSRVSELTKKYADWMVLPMMASPQKTIDYITRPGK
jgi:glyoxylase-like metal-dependent hydrolase (beta-lactamase superfamily II)